MKRKFRLSSNIDFKRVRRFGKSYAHPLIVLVALPNDLSTSRFGVSAGRSVGNAVQRNRVKRQIREILRSLIPQTQTGWDIVILARKSITSSSFREIEDAFLQLHHKANLCQE